MDKVALCSPSPFERCKRFSLFSRISRFLKGQTAGQTGFLPQPVRGFHRRTDATDVFVPEEELMMAPCKTRSQTAAEH